MAKLLDQRKRVPLVLLPGTLCDPRLFAPLVAALPDRPVSVGDMHGLGTAAALAERLLAEAPPLFALLGFSLGAIVALEAARRAPERIVGLALVGGTARDVPSRSRANRRAAAAEVRSAERHVAETLWADYVADTRDHARRALVVDMARACPPDAWPLQTEVALSRADARGWLPDLAMPTLVLAGAQDRINPPPVQREMAALLRHARLELVPNSGHFVLLERPDATAHAVRTWLNELDERAFPLCAARPTEEKS